MPVLLFSPFTFCHKRDAKSIKQTIMSTPYLHATVLLSRVHITRTIIIKRRMRQV